MNVFILCIPPCVHVCKHVCVCVCARAYAHTFSITIIKWSVDVQIINERKRLFRHSNQIMLCKYKHFVHEMFIYIYIYIYIYDNYLFIIMSP